MAKGFSDRDARRIGKVTKYVEKNFINGPVAPGALSIPVVHVRQHLRGKLNDSVSAGGSVLMTVYNGDEPTDEEITVYNEAEGKTIATDIKCHCLFEYASGRYYITSPFNC